MSIRVNVGAGLNPNSVGRAIVKSVKYDPCEWSSIGQEQIYMETNDGRRCNWFINNFCNLRIEEFVQAREDIKSGKITEGIEVTIIYNPNGILAFRLDN